MTDQHDQQPGEPARLDVNNPQDMEYLIRSGFIWRGGQKTQVKALQFLLENPDIEAEVAHTLPPHISALLQPGAATPPPVEQPPVEQPPQPEPGPAPDQSLLDTSAGFDPNAVLDPSQVEDLRGAATPPVEPSPDQTGQPMVKE